MYQSFKNSNLSIRKDSSTGFISIGIKHQSPKKAKEILSLFIDELDTHFRENKGKTATESLNYLNSQYQSSANQRLNESISALIQKNLETLALANISQRFVIQDIDPPDFPEVKIYPQRLSLLIIATSFFTVFIILMFVIIGIRGKLIT